MFRLHQWFNRNVVTEVTLNELMALMYPARTFSCITIAYIILEFFLTSEAKVIYLTCFIYLSRENLLVCKHGVKTFQFLSCFWIMLFSEADNPRLSNFIVCFHKKMSNKRIYYVRSPNTTNHIFKFLHNLSFLLWLFNSTN